MAQQAASVTHTGEGTAEARLIIAASEADANLFYATRFLAPDPFVYLRHGQETILLVSDLELDRALPRSGFSL